MIMICALGQKIYRREQSKVKDIDTFKNFIRYNDYLKDEIS